MNLKEEPDSRTFMPSVQSWMNTKVHTYPKQNKVISAIQPPGPRTCIKGWAYRGASVDLIQFTVERFHEYVSHVGDDYAISAVAYELYPSAKLCEVGKMDIALRRVGVNLIVLLLRVGLTRNMIRG